MQPVSVKTRNYVLKHCTKWCLKHSENPGNDGIITEIADKLIIAYPQFACQGTKMEEKTVYILRLILISFREMYEFQ